MAKKKKAKMGRPRIPIDLKMLERLAEVGCSMAEIASMLRRSGLQVDAKTVERRLKDPIFATCWHDGFNAMKVGLRSTMVRQSKMMNSGGVMQSQFLAKQYLGMKEKVELSGEIEVTDSAHDRLARKLDTLAKRLNGRTAGAAEADRPAALPEKSVG